MAHGPLVIIIIIIIICVTLIIFLLSEIMAATLAFFSAHNCLAEAKTPRHLFLKVISPSWMRNDESRCHNLRG